MKTSDMGVMILKPKSHQGSNTHQKLGEKKIFSLRASSLIQPRQHPDFELPPPKNCDITNFCLKPPSLPYFAPESQADGNDPIES
jgi:hypothetical protein